MSSIITVWGTLTFPPGAQRAWRALSLDGGSDGGDGEYGGYFADEHEPVLVEEALGRADEAHPFVRFAARGDLLDVRAGLGDDYWSEWLAILGGLARAAATVGAAGALEVEDDGRLVGRLMVSKKGATWKDAGRGDEVQDRAGEEAVHRIFGELVAAARAPKKKAPAKKAAPKKAPAKRVVVKKAPAKGAGSRKALAKKA